MKKVNKTIFSQIMSGIFKFLAVFLSLLAIIIIIIPASLSLFKGQDISPVEENELKLQIVDISQSENFFYDLNYDMEKIRNLVILKNIPKEKEFVANYLESDTWDREVVESILVDNEKILDDWTRASLKGKFQLPYANGLSEVSADMPVTPFNVYREISRLSGLKAIYLVKSGQEEEAFAEAMKNIIIGNSIENSQGPLITYLTGRAIKDTGLDVLQKVISLTPKDSKVLLNYPFELDRYQVANDFSPFIIEYIVSKQSLENKVGDSIFEKILINNDFYFKKNLTLSYYYDFYYKLNKEARKDCSELTPVSYPFKPLQENNLLKLYFTENLIGKLYSYFPAAAFNSVLEKKCATEQKLKETNLIIKGR